MQYMLEITFVIFLLSNDNGVNIWGILKTCLYFGFHGGLSIYLEIFQVLVQLKQRIFSWEYCCI